MELRAERLGCDEVKKFDIVDYLASIGHHPKRIIGNYFWYLTPYRDERKPSFRVNRSINRWKDFSDGTKGGVIDLGILCHQCATVGDFLKIINGNLSFQRPFVAPPKVDPDSPEEKKKKIIVTANKPLFHVALLNYLKERRIPFEIADRYCRQIHFSLYEKDMFAIGFKTNLGGWELRNPLFKGGSSPKGITTISVPGATSAAVFEGFFDFLTYQTLFRHEKRHEDLIILNSLVFFEESRTILESYKETNLFLDNNKPGRDTTKYALSKSPCYKDRSSLYANYEDLNYFIRGIRMPSTRPRLRISTR